MPRPEILGGDVAGGRGTDQARVRGDQAGQSALGRGDDPPRRLVVTAIAGLSIAVVAAPASAAPGPLKPAEAVCKAQGGEFVFSGPTASLLCSRPSPFSDAQF